MSARLDAREGADELLRSVQRQEKPDGGKRVLSQRRRVTPPRSNYVIRRSFTPTRHVPVPLYLLIHLPFRSFCFVVI